jgi:hypothetical protein
MKIAQEREEEAFPLFPGQFGCERSIALRFFGAR